MKSVSIGCLGSEIFTRRTATVTISAPDASTAAAFSSKLLYLPVPTISREVKVRPATRPAVGLDVLLRGHSPASDEMHDLIIVAVLDADLRRASPRGTISRLRSTATRSGSSPSSFSISATLIPPGTRRCSPLTRIPEAAIDSH